MDPGGDGGIGLPHLPPGPESNCASHLEPCPRRTSDSCRRRDGARHRIPVRDRLQGQQRLDRSGPDRAHRRQPDRRLRREDESNRHPHPAGLLRRQREPADPLHRRSLGRWHDPLRAAGRVRSCLEPRRADRRGRRARDRPARRHAGRTRRDLHAALLDLPDLQPRLALPRRHPDPGSARDRGPAGVDHHPDRRRLDRDRAGQGRRLDLRRDRAGRDHRHDRAGRSDLRSRPHAGRVPDRGQPCADAARACDEPCGRWITVLR